MVDDVRHHGRQQQPAITSSSLWSAAATGALLSSRLRPLASYNFNCRFMFFASMNHNILALVAYIGRNDSDNTSGVIIATAENGG